MSAHAMPSPVGGKLFTKPFLIILAIAAVGAALMLWRLNVGLGPSTALSDGYPWGIWIAFDVVTGTAMGAGGYALAILIYVLNKGKYHPLIRGALVTTALGYTIAGVSVFIDVGRWWNLWRIPISIGDWNGNSALLEVAICIMAYMAVAWVEVGATLLSKKDSAVRKALPFIIALGVLLPTMHQSSLGTLMVLTAKLHPLWHTSMLPLLFLISCVAMGYGGVILESAISTRAFRREAEWPILAKLSRVIAGLTVVYVVLRLVDVVSRGALDGASSGYTMLFGLELVLFLVPALILFTEKRKNPGWLFGSAALLVFAGALYRFDTYLVAFNPGPQYSYFPSVTEMLMTFGLVAIELGAYVFIVKKFPVLTGRAPAKA